MTCLNSELDTDREQIIQRLKRKKSNNISYKNNTKSFTVNSSFFDVLNCSEISIAQQITLNTHSKMCKIEKKEFLNGNFDKENRDELSQNLSALYKQFNDMTNWLTEEILSYDKSRLRSIAIEKFILIAYECFNLNNFNDSFNIMVALTTNRALSNLKKSWKKVKPSAKAKLDELDNFFQTTKNSYNLRNKLDLLQGVSPCIPYFGFFTGNLAYISSWKYILHNSDNNIELLNIEKIKKTADFINKFYFLINSRVYPIKNNQSLSFLKNLKPLNENELIDLSAKLGNNNFLIVEPKFILKSSKSIEKRMSNTDKHSFNINPSLNKVEIQIDDNLREKTRGSKNSEELNLDLDLDYFK